MAKKVCHIGAFIETQVCHIGALIETQVCQGTIIVSICKSAMTAKTMVRISFGMDCGLKQNAGNIVIN